MSAHAQETTLEAKIVVLGSQGVGKTSLVHRFVKNAFIPPDKAQSTVGASFITARVTDPETNTTIRLQIWDTAGQERFRSISRLYYRGANAAILCYDVGNSKTFEDMGRWLEELRENCGNDIVIHVVDTKTDVLASGQQKRQVPFERCIEYVSEKLYPENATLSVGRSSGSASASDLPSRHGFPPAASNSNRSSGFGGQDQIFDCCHEVSAKDGEGIDEVFRIIARKLVEQNNRKIELQRVTTNTSHSAKSLKSDTSGTAAGYFDLPQAGTGSFRLGAKRKSWLGLPTPDGLTSFGDAEVDAEVAKGMRSGRCC